MHAELSSRRIFRRSAAVVVVANVVGFVVVTVYTVLVSPSDRAAAGSAPVLAFVGPALYAAACVVFGVGWARRRFAPVQAAVDAARPLTTGEVGVAFAFPVDASRLVLTCWLTGAAIVGLVGLAAGSSDQAGGAQTVIAIALGGVTTGLLSLLLLERRMRPLFAIVLGTESAPPETGLGIRRRLLLSWGLGSGVPLVVLLVAPTGEEVSRGHLQALHWYLGVVGLGAGALLVMIAAQSVAEPVARLRVAVRAVQEGSLDVAVEVDDSGEVGLLQAGFNRMVAGLRERERVQDVFGRHVGVEVARAAIAGDEGRVAAREHDVTVLFVDVIGSTGLAERLAPADVVAALDRFFAVVVQTTHAEGGWVNKFAGDGALCVFGAPEADADHAARGLRAAVALRRALSALPAAPARLDAGIGVSSGRVVAGNVGAEDRYEYTVIGAPVNEAARLTEMAKEVDGRVLASGAALAAAPGEAAAWRFHAVVGLRGRAEPTDTFVPTTA
ncbi:MAG TPA: adenylate/guanylate cyclase domain-containing protein [Acidimicrobiales bacterium]|nr:adenylate/guanylate cyclase domain-containing protein [Acidimicrobiales bacterium]